MINVLVLDFDGVILESVAVKDRAFYDLFDEADSKIQEEVLAFHKRTPGVHRKKKIELIFSEIFGRSPTSEDVNRALTRFSSLVQKGLMLCPEVPGVRSFLDNVAGRIPCYIVSAAPQNELKALASQRNYSHYFVYVFGGPALKKDQLNKVIQKENGLKTSVLFIGDQLSDLKAAKAVGTAFIGRRLPVNPPVFPKDIVLIDDFIKGEKTIMNLLQLK